MKYVPVFHQRPAALFKIVPYDFVRGTQGGRPSNRGMTSNKKKKLQPKRCLNSSNKNFRFFKAISTVLSQFVAFEIKKENAG